MQSRARSTFTPRKPRRPEPRLHPRKKLRRPIVDGAFSSCGFRVLRYVLLAQAWIVLRVILFLERHRNVDIRSESAPLEVGTVRENGIYRPAVLPDQTAHVA